MKKSNGVSKASWGWWGNASQRFHPVARNVHGGFVNLLKSWGTVSSGGAT